jgi:hypothetical protein
MIKESCRSFNFKKQERNTTTEEIFLFIEEIFGKNGVSNLYGDINWRMLPHFNKTESVFDPTFCRTVFYYQILLLPEEEEYRKFVIVPQDFDVVNFDRNDKNYTGWVCNERQHQHFLNIYTPDWDIGGEIFLNDFIHSETGNSCMVYADFHTDNRKIFCASYNHDTHLCLYVDFDILI